MIEFTIEDTKQYLAQAKREDINSETLCHALNSAISSLSIGNAFITIKRRATPEFCNKTKEDLKKLKKHTDGLCALLGIEKDGNFSLLEEVESTNILKKGILSKKKLNPLKHKHRQHRNDFYFGLQTLLSGKGHEWDLGITSEQLGSKYKFRNEEMFHSGLKEIAKNIHMLRIIAKNSIKTLKTQEVIIIFRDNISKDLNIPNNISPERWLIGHKLPEIYHQFFGGKPQFQYDRQGRTTKPSGKGLDFFMWCLNKIGIKLSPNTVTEYYYDANPSIPIRKAVKKK